MKNFNGPLKKFCNKPLQKWKMKNSNNLLENSRQHEMRTTKRLMKGKK